MSVKKLNARRGKSNQRKAGELPGGSVRMRQLGYREVQVWLAEAEVAAIKRHFPGEKIASLLRRLACEATLIRFTSR